MSHEGPVYTNSRYSNSSSSERGSTSRPTLDYFGPTNNIANINNSFSNMKVFGRVVQSQSVSLNSGAAYLSQPPTPSISDTNASHLSQYRQMSGSSTSGFYNSNIHQILQSPGNSNNHTNLAHFPPRHNSTSGYSYYSQVDTVGNLNGVMPPTPPHRNLSVADRSSVLGFSDCYGNSGSAGWPSQPSPPVVAAGPLFPMSKANTSSSTSGSVPLFFSDLPNTNSSTEANRSKPLLSNEPSINKYAYRNSDSTGSVTDENNNGNTKKPVLDATEMSRIVRQSGLSQNAHNPYLKRGSEDDGVTMDMLSTSHSKQGSGSTPIRVSGGPSGEVRLSDEGKERTSAEGSSPPVQQPVVEEEDMQANSTLGFIEEGGQVIGSSPVVKSISVNSVSGGGGTIQGPENLPITHQTLAFVSNEAVDPTKESKILLTEDSHDSKVRVGEGCGDSLRRRRSSNTGMDNILLRSTEADGSSKEHEGDDQTKNGHPDEEKNVPPSEDQSGLESDGEASTTNTTNTFVTGSEYSDRPSSAFSDVDSEMRGETEGTSADMRLPSILDTNSSKVVSPPSHTPRKSRQSVVLIRDRKDSLDVRGASKSNSEAMSSGNGSGTFYSEMGNSRRRTALPQQLSHTLLPAEDGKDSLENTARPLSSSTKKSKRLGSVSTETNKASKASEIKRTEDADTTTVESRSLVTPKEKPKKKKAVKESVAKQPEPSLPAKPKKKHSVPPTKTKSPGTKKRSVSTKKRKSSATPTGELQVDSRGSSPNRGSKGSAEIPFSLTSPGRSKSTDSVRFSINEEAVPSPGEADKANKGKVIRPIGTRRESVLRKRASSVNSSRAGSFFSVSSSRNSSLSRSGSASSSKRGSHMLASLDNITQRCLDSVPYQSFKEKDVWKSAKKYRKLVSTELLKWHMHGYQFILKEEAEAFKRLTESVIQPPLRSALEREVTRLARERERIAKKQRV
ncbi:hypothetical protein ADEAN_000323100 [Angomonas deanei]|uniref:Uncharacterized protein n=1 Tax=Angomonas deanei TaxID=59799 RepID=A0A7G2CAJ0_9TRYP|nr:hypothetical protein ADEAN_000323100 [Angomonas deanei]